MVLPPFWIHMHAPLLFATKSQGVVHVPCLWFYIASGFWLSGATVSVGAAGLLVLLFVLGLTWNQDQEHLQELGSLPQDGDGANADPPQLGTYANPHTYASFETALDPKPDMIPIVNTAWHNEVLKNFLKYKPQNASIRDFTPPPQYLQEMHKREAMVAVHNPKLIPLYTPAEFNVTVSNTKKVNDEIARRVAMVVKHLPNTDAAYNWHTMNMPCVIGPCVDQGKITFNVKSMMGQKLHPGATAEMEAKAADDKKIEAHSAAVAKIPPWQPHSPHPNWELENKHAAVKHAALMTAAEKKMEAADAWANKIMGDEDGGNEEGGDDEGIPGR